MSGLGLALAGWAVGWLLLWRVPRLRGPVPIPVPVPVPVRPPRRGRSVPSLATPAGSAVIPAYAVVVPARDEAHNLGPLLAQIREQSVTPAEVVVVDDHSSDGTADVARAAGARVVSAPPLPPGWVGKTWACQHGADATTAPVVVFLDADVRLAPDALASVVAELGRRGGIVSVAPWHVVVRPYEWLSLFFSVVAVMGVGFASAVGLRTRGAFGPCIAVSRDDYLRMGGHTAVRGDVVEDLALAERAATAGLAVTVVGGRPVMTYRMYPTGIKSLLEGWTKNIATGARHSRLERSLPIGLWIAGAISAVLAVPGGGVVAAAVLALWVVQVAWMSRQVGRFPVLAWLAFPVLLAAFVAVFLRSMVQTSIRHEVTWRGRTIAVEGS